MSYEPIFTVEDGVLTWTFSTPEHYRFPVEVAKLCTAIRKGARFAPVRWDIRQGMPKHMVFSLLQSAMEALFVGRQRVWANMTLAELCALERGFKAASDELMHIQSPRRYGGKGGGYQEEIPESVKEFFEDLQVRKNELALAALEECVPSGKQGKSRL